MSSTLSQILVGLNDKVVCIRVRGKGTFLNSVGIKQFAKEMIHRGHREFVVDLEECPVMDSTFMGTLTGVALQLRSIGQGHMHMVHCNHRNVDLLRGLGLDQILDLADDDEATYALPRSVSCEDEVSAENQNTGGSSLPTVSSKAPDDRLETTETMIAAHQALVDADPKNFSRFKDVLDYLKQDLAKCENGKRI